MRVVGKRKIQAIVNEPSGELLKAGALFNEMMSKAQPNGNTNHIPKGIYHFKSHAEMNAHKEDCIASGMN